MNRVGRFFEHQLERPHRGEIWMEEEPDCDSPEPAPLPATPPAEKWKEAFTFAVVNWMEKAQDRVRQQQQLEVLTRQLRALEHKLSSLAFRQCVIAPLNSLAPEPYEVIKEIKVVIEQTDEDEFVASFYDANIHASGCNSSDAFDNLKSLLVSRFTFLDAYQDEKLGRAMKKQKAVLREFIGRKA